VSYCSLKIRAKEIALSNKKCLDSFLKDRGSVRMDIDAAFVLCV
jgi:hypothetical protein